MRNTLIRHSISFRHAFDGVVWSFRTQPNLKIHLFFGVFAASLGVLLGLSRLEWLILLPTIFSVFIAELFNTAIELTTDGLKAHKKSENDDRLIMYAKDISAAAVLLTATLSIIVGVILFLPKLLVV